MEFSDDKLNTAYIDICLTLCSYVFIKTHKDKDPAESSKIVNKRSTYFFIGLLHFDVLENFICRRNNYIYFVASILFDFNAISWLMSHHL